MISLSNYIKDIHKFDWDGHIHLFNSSQSLLDIYSPKSNYLIGFPDIEYDNIEEYEGKMIDLYQNYIDNHYENNQILLATAPTSKECIEIYKKFPNIIKGFGELKLYDSYIDKDIPYKKISTAREVCAYSSKVGNLPVYIHYSLTNDKEVKRLDNLLRSYPNTPIILCHCGMDKSNKDFAYYSVVDLMKKYSNIWIDISYDALDYFTLTPFKLYNLDLNRIILGTDINLKLFSPKHNSVEECNEIYSKIKELMKYINSNKNTKTLFNI